MSQPHFPGLEYDPQTNRYFPVGTKRPKLIENKNERLILDLTKNKIVCRRGDGWLYGGGSTHHDYRQALRLKNMISTFPDHRISHNAVFDSKNRCFLLGSSPQSPSILSVLDPDEPSRIRSIYAPFIESPITEMKFSGNYGLLAACEDVFLVKVSKDPDRYPIELACIKREVASRRYVKNLDIRDVSGGLEGLGYAFSYDNHLVYTLSAAEPTHFSISPVRQSISTLHFCRGNTILTAHSHGLLLLHHSLDQRKKPPGEPYRRFQLTREKDAAKWIQGSRDRNTFAAFSFHNQLCLFDIRIKDGNCIGTDVQLVEDGSASTAIVSDSFLQNFYYGVPGRSQIWMHDIRNLSVPALKVNFSENKLQNLHMYRDEKILIEMQTR